MPNKQGMFVQLKATSAQRLTFRESRLADGLTMKVLAAEAGVRESLLNRYEHGQQLVRVEEVEGLKNAHKLLKLNPPEMSEPFEYAGGGNLPGFKYRKKRKSPKQPEVVGHLSIPATHPVGPPAVNELKTSYFFPKWVNDSQAVFELHKRGILSAEAVKDAIYQLIKEHNK